MIKKTKYKRPVKGTGKNQEAVSRLTMEKHLKRKLTSKELVHHINCDPTDNRLCNLLLVDRAEHKKIHSEIGVSTRFKTIYFFNESKILKKYKKCYSASKIAKEYGCHMITMERFIRKILGVKRLNHYKREVKNDLRAAR